MNRLTDDILNKYLDGELDDITSIEVEKLLAVSTEDRKNFQALQIVHNGLKNLKLAEVRADFTSTLVSSLMKKSKAGKEQNIFIASIGTIFLVASLVIVGFALSLIIGSAPQSPESAPFVDDFVFYIQNSFKELIMLTTKNLSIIGSAFSLLMLLSAYFFFENHKKTKESLNKFG